MNTQTQRIKSFLATGLAAASILTCQSSRAALFDKADNANALNVAASWTNNTTVPGSGDTAQWDSVVSAANTTETLGGSMAWNGINIFNPPTAITVNTNTGGNVLTLGSGGINMLSASQGFNLNSSITLAAPQHWTVGNNQTLTTTGPLARNAGTAIFFSFDNSSAQAIVSTNTTGVLVQGNNTLIIDGVVGAGTGAGTPFATYNDIDYAGLDANNHVVSASTLPGGLLYSTNINGNAPTLPTTFSGIVDVANTNSFGLRVRTTTEVDGFRFNTPQPNAPGANVFGFNGAGAWDVLYNGNVTLDVNSILLTTNLGTTPVIFTPGGVMRIADALNELTVIQNNPASSLIWQVPISNRTAGGIVAKLGPGTMEVQAACTYTGGTIINGGTILNDGNGSLGAGPITVNPGGNFEGQSGATNFAPVVVTPGATNSVLIASANGQFNNLTNLTFDAGTTWLQFIYSNSIVPSTTTAPLLVTAASSSLTASNNVNVNVICPALSVGQFPLIKYGTFITNSAGTFPFNLFGLQPHVLGYLSNNVANSSIDLVITNVDQPIHWAAGSGVWDIANTVSWIDNLGNTTTYQQAFGLGDNVVFNDSATGPSPVTATLNTTVTPGSVTVSNNAISYTISGSGSIAGANAFTKIGVGTVVLGTANTFKGGININGGIVNFSTLANLGAGVIKFAGGTLQYNGNSDDISVRTVSFGAGGGTIDTAGSTVSYAKTIGTGAGGGLTKTGAGTLTLNGSNSIAGPVTVNQGTLALGTSSYISNSSAIIVNSGAVLDANTSGVNLTLASGVSQVLAGIGTVDGLVTAPLNTTISPATNGVYGTINLANGLTVSGGTLAMDISSSSKDLINVTGNLTLSSGTLAINVSGTLADGRYKLISYNGTLASGAGSSGNITLVGFTQPLAVATLSDSVAGEIDLVVATSASDHISWSGTGSTWDQAGTLDWLLNGGATPWAFTNGDIVRFDDTGVGNPSVALEAVLLPSSVIISNNAASPYIWTDGTGVGGGKVSGPAGVVKDGPGTFIAATANSYTGPTTIKNGVMQIGQGGIGDIGTGTVTNNATLIFDQGDANTHTVAGTITGTGTVTDEGNSPLALATNNTYTGGTAITAGALQVGTGGAAGSLGTGPVTNNASLYLDRSGTYALANTITGSGALVQIGGGTVTTAPGYSYLGNTYVSNGVVKLTGNEQIPDANNVAGSTGWLVLDGSPSYAGTFDLAGFNETINSLSGVAGTFNGIITNSGTSSAVTNTLTILENAATTYNGIIQEGSGSKIKLVLEGNSTLRLNGANSFSGGVIVGGTATYGIGPGYNPVNGGIIMSNGTTYDIINNGSTGPNAGDNITIVNGGGASFNSGQLGNIYGGNVTGGLTSTNYIIGPVSEGNTTDQYANFLGVVQIQPGGSLRFSSTTTTGINGSESATFDLEGSGVLQTRNNFNVHCGALQGNGFITEPQAGGTGIGNFVIGYNNNSTTFNGGISGSNNIVKVGTGTLTLSCGTGDLVTSPDGGLTFVTNQVAVNNLLSYAGSTTISNGVLQLLAPTVLTNYPTPITLASPTAVLDGTQMGFINTDGSTFTNIMTNGVFEVIASQTLAGVGTIKASNVLMDAGSILNVGLPTGLLTVTANQGISLAGAVNLNINPSNSVNSELSASSFTVVPGATLSITNLNTNFVGTVVYHMFNSAINTNNFAAITLPVVTSPVVMSNLLSLNGTLVFVAPSNVNLNPTNLLFSVINNGTTLSLSWPADHLSWQLQVQTNTLAVGLATNNWVTWPGTELVTSTNLPINPSNGSVFYRMTHP